MYLRGESISNISLALALPPEEVRVDLRAIRKQWLQSALLDFAEAKARELAKLDEMERAAWAAFEQSKFKKRQAQTAIPGTPTRDNPTPPPIPQRATLYTEDDAGDPRYLQLVLSCIDRRCKMLGLDAPVRVTASQESADAEYGSYLTPGQRAERLAEMLGALVVEGTIVNTTCEPMSLLPPEQQTPHDPNVLNEGDPNRDLLL